MPQAHKVAKLDEINASLNEAKSIFLTDFSGLTVEEVTRLRAEFRKQNVKYLVVKNTLARISAREHGFDVLVPYLHGPTALAIAMGDPVAPVRVIFDFKKDKEKPAIKAALLEGQLLDQKAAEEVRNVPSREVLLARALASMQAPATNMAGVLAAIPRKLVYALNAIKATKQ